MSDPEKRKILGLILARGGSKRLPGKNIRNLHGKPLIAWTAEAAASCGVFNKLVLSTDSQPIADVVAPYGVEIPFLRPDHLAADLSTSEDAVLHALDFLRDQQGLNFDAVMLMEPTSPLRAKGDFAGVLRLLTEHWADADAVVGAGRVQLEQPAVMKSRSDAGFLTPLFGVDEGLRNTAWFPYGGMYAVKVETLRQGRSFYPSRLLGYEVQRWQNYEVDDEFDFLCVEAILNRFQGKLP
ncbi:MAG: acylneuraminate cytidylyltransferase family protein [Pseudomonadota bacterium]